MPAADLPAAAPAAPPALSPGRTAPRPGAGRPKRKGKKARPAGTGELLAAAVSDLGGSERPGQVTMARAVADAMRTDKHLVVEAGTGTGKSLAYLVPALAHALRGGGTVVVSTATIALQRQLVDRDLPRLGRVLTRPLGRRPVVAILKGRRNYLCLHKVHGEAAAAEEDPAAVLFAAPRSRTGRQVRRLHEWAVTTETGDRDELVPGVDDRAWRQVSVSARECLGAQECAFADRCFAERARQAAGDADVVVTNHALLAIDAMADYDVLPEHEVVVIDEAHELTDRVTSVAAGELSAAAAETAGRRAGKKAAETSASSLAQAAEGLGKILARTAAGRMDVLAPELGAAIAAVRDAAAACAADLRASRDKEGDGAERSLAAQTAEVALEEISQAASRLLAAFAAPIPEREEVVWLDRPPGEDAVPDTLRVAPLSVADVLAERLFGQRTVIMTSATLTLGGSFGTLARQWGLPDDDSWTRLDVGSPFDHRKAGILYIARHLPPPGRDGLPAQYLTEMAELITAAGGRTLGLFSSMRAARQAADALAPVLDVPLACQGDDATGALVSAFAADETSCLFGTLSLWQGVDVPGRALQLVIIDRIPFPRPDDPLASARQRAEGARGGNGFMTVAAAHAALLLAQGTGRLLRSGSDRGVIAILDPRMATAGYSGFLRDSLPPYWASYDGQLVRAALRRLAAGSG